ncbi:MAG: glucose 1-dehydrogenase [Thermoplasmata archaeon]
MQAVVVRPPAGGASLEEVAEPSVGAGEVKVAVLELGVCGTDRDIVSGKYGTPPVGETSLILGHENLGRVTEVGEGVEGWAPGDLVVATVRRGCGACRFCRAGRSDFCETGRFTERGIRGAHGYLAEYYVERPDYLVKVPKRLRPFAVLLEPMSVVEKAVDEGRRVLDRKEPTPGERPTSAPRALVAGTGAIGMLAAFLLRSEGFEVCAIDRHGDDTLAGGLLPAIGARHVNVANGLSALGGATFDLAVEASGSAALDFGLMSTLSANGVLVLTGIPAADAPSEAVQGGALWRTVVLENQAIVGSVNANRRHFASGIRHMTRFRREFGETIERLITSRRPMAEFRDVLTERTAGSMKTVLVVRP